MAGHSKWSKVKHIKGPSGVKCGAQFSKLVKEITVATAAEAATDNKNRTDADLRFIFSKHGGSVIYMFHKGEQITVPRSLADANCTLDLKLDAGVEKLATEGTAAHVLPQYETLADNDDTQNVYLHFDIPEALLARLPA